MEKSSLSRKPQEKFVPWKEQPTPTGRGSSATTRTSKSAGRGKNKAMTTSSNSVAVRESRLSRTVDGLGLDRITNKPRVVCVGRSRQMSFSAPRRQSEVHMYFEKHQGKLKMMT